MNDTKSIGRRAVQRSLFISAFLCLTCGGYGQLSGSSYVFLHLDKHFCYPSATIRFAAYAIKDKEDNCYVELYTDSLLIRRSVFPVVKGIANGSMVMPGRPGSYWLRAYTFHSRYFVTPLTVLPDSATVIACQFPKPPGLIKDLPVVIQKKGSDSLTIAIADSTIQQVSVSIADPSLPDPGFTLLPSRGSFDHPETENLEFSGTVHWKKRKDKLVQWEELVVIVEKDSTYRLMTLQTDSAGFFSIAHLNFRDTGYLNFEINTLADDKPEISITPAPKDYPSFAPPGGCGFDTLRHVDQPGPKSDSVRTTSGKYLPPAIVHAHWADRNAALDHRYASAWYQGHTRYNFNLMDSNRTKYCSDLGDFLVKELGGDRITGFPFGGYRVYLDEVELLDPQWINNFDVHTDLAYVKIIEDMGEKPILAIYHRKGMDARAIPGHLNRLSVIGYATASPFTRPDGTTSLWIPDQKGPTFTIRKFFGRVLIAGVNQRGTPFCYSTIIK